METNSFYLLNKVQEDLRAGPAHISLMAAILKLKEERGDACSVCATGMELRAVARIGGKAVYYRVLKDLQRFGYIRYMPFHEHKRVGRIEVVE